MNAPKLSIVVPCYNEQEVVAQSCERLARVIEALVWSGNVSESSEILLVDDGSTDGTWAAIERCMEDRFPVVGVKLSRNCGHQNALLAGLRASSGDAIVTIDADLQDDEAAIAKMVDAFRAGHEIVYGVRSSRASDSWFKRTTAQGFYRFMKCLGVKTVFDHADYRLLSRRAAQWLQDFGEVNLFLRGVVPLLGLRTAIVQYERRARFAGESKYPLRKMIEFALNGITSFSVAPLRAITALGFAVAMGCVLLAGWALIVKLTSQDAVPGWASTILPIYFLGGVQLLCAGVLGEYVGKIYMEVKQRPRFFVERVATSAAPARASAGEAAAPAALPAGVRAHQVRASARGSPKLRSSMVVRMSSTGRRTRKGLA